MKILLVPPCILPVPAAKGGAIENTIESIIKYNEINKDHEYTVVSIYDEKAANLSKKYKYTDIEYIKLTIIDKILNKLMGTFFFDKIIFVMYCIKAKRKLKNRSFDLVIIHNRPHYYKYFKPLSKQIALHLHNDKLNKDTKNARKIAKQYDYFFSVSNYIKRKTSEVISESKIETLYNGVDFDLFQGTKNELRRKKNRAELGIPEGSTVFLYTGRLVAAKGVFELIKAFNKASINRDIYLVIVGGSKNEAGSDLEYQKMLKKVANEKVIFSGYVEHSELPKYEELSDIGVVPSLFEEPFGKVVIEHLASNNRVIVSDAGGIPEIVRDLEQGVIVNRNDDFIDNLCLAIIDFSDNNMIYTARETVREFEIDKFNYKRLKIINKRK